MACSPPFLFLVAGGSQTTFPLHVTAEVLDVSYTLPNDCGGRFGGQSEAEPFSVPI